MRASPALPAALPAFRTERLRVAPAVVWVGTMSVLAFALRLFWVFYTDAVPLGGDPHWYYVVAGNLARGFGFVVAHNELFEMPGPGEPTAYWPPGYPFALAAIFNLFGVSVTAAQVFNAALGALTVPFVYLLGRAIFDARAGLAAAALFAVFPNAIAGIPLLFSEPLFTLLFAAALWLLVERSSGWLAVTAFGALTGMALLTRGQGIVLIPIALAFWMARDGWRRAVGPTAVAVLAAASVITPWTVRNAIELHAFVPVSTSSGTVLRSGHAPEANGTTMWTRDEVGGFRTWESNRRPDWEVQGYREYTRRAIGYALTHPRRELELSGLKLYNLYRADADVIPFLTTLGGFPLKPDGFERPLRALLETTYHVLFFAATLSVPFWLRRDPRRVLLASVFVFWTLFHVATLAEPRYHAPLYPAFALAVAGGFCLAVDSARSFLKRRA